jgi:hypothetical protein
MGMLWSAWMQLQFNRRDTEYFVEWHINKDCPISDMLSFNGRIGHPSVEVVSVELRLYDEVLRACAVNDIAPTWSRSLGMEDNRLVGYSAYILLGDLPSDFSLELYALDVSGRKVHIGAVVGHHSGSQLDVSTRVIPLMVTSLGRSGSTYLMSLLGSHPKIACPMVYPYEMRVMAYQWKIFQTIARASDYENSIHPDGFEYNSFFVGSNPYFSEVYFNNLPKDVVRDWFMNRYVRLSAEAAKATVESYYRALVQEYDKSNAMYLAEKFSPSSLNNQLWYHYNSAKEVFLVRDYRDTILSWLSFDSKRGKNKGAAMPSFDSVSGAYLGDGLRMVDSFNSRKDRALLVRYEDLITYPERELKRIGVYLDLDPAPWLYENSNFDAAHGTSKSAVDSVYRWRRQLSRAENSMAVKVHHRFLEAFGYDKD